jgi:hypothetical protein
MEVWMMACIRREEGRIW